MHNGFQLVARIPFTFREPRHLFLASEVATLRYLKTQGIPVPEVYSYSTTAENEAETEYVFMELVKGQKLGKLWFDLDEKDTITAVANIVALEAKLFALEFPASGSLYHTGDLPAEYDRVEM